MRALLPDASGYADSTGARIYFEVFGDGPATILLLPTWALVHSRTWKLQIPYLARHYRVIAFDPRGNGKSSRSSDPADHTYGALVTDALAVMDATATPSATTIGYSRGGIVLAMLAVQHPSRVDGAVFIGPVSPFGGPPPRNTYPWSVLLEETEGWAKHNKHYWRRDFDGWLQFFAGKLFTEPHSTKGIEDAIAWGHETNAEVLIATYEAPVSADEPPRDPVDAAEYYGRIRCPVLVIHGSDDGVIAHSIGAGVAETTGGTLVTIEGGGHSPHVRHPVKVNLLIRRFLEATSDRRA